MVKEESDNTTETVVKDDAGDVPYKFEKNAIMILNELRSDLKYNLIEQSGPPHKPTFKVSLEIEDKVYIGMGNSKKAAKTDAANQALKDNPPRNLNKHLTNNSDDKNEKNPLLILNEIRSFLNYDLVEHTGPVHSPTFKIAVEVDGKVYYGTGNTKKAAKYQAAAQVLKDNPNLINEGKKSTKKGAKTMNGQEKNPISVLNEMFANLNFNLIEYRGPVHNPTFKVSVEVNGKEYLGISNSKKAAKLEAAVQALKSFNNTTSSVKNDTESDKLTTA